MPGLPFNAAASEARAFILSVLSSWSGLVAQKRHVTPPPRDVSQLACFLTRHLGWLVASEAAAEASKEIAQLVTRARRATAVTSRRRVRVGACVETGCTGELVALVRPDEARLQGEIRCTTEAGHRWQVEEWLRLGRLLNAEPAGARLGRWLGATDIARLWGVPTGTVYRLANEHAWNRRSVGTRVQYDGADVERTFEYRSDRSA